MAKLSFLSHSLNLLVCLVAARRSLFDDNDNHFLRIRSLQNATNNCTIECCRAAFPDNGCVEESSSPISGLPTSVSIIFVLFLLSMSALFSGLTLGLLSLDTTGLEIVMEGDNATDAAYARKIYPIRKDGNLLLCTLLLGNTSVNALISILMADFTGGVAGFISSTFLILLFGEIIPQAACSRYALEVGGRVVPLVRVIIVLFYPIAKPLAFALDKALGKELATTYSSAELLHLLQIHVQENAMDLDTANTMTGALKYKNTKVGDVMTPLNNTFMLRTDEKLDFETIAKIFKTGYSRIPVYEVSKNNVIGLLFVKDLIFIDPNDGTRVRDFVEIFGRGVHVVWPDDKLGEVLKELKRGRSHMALVRDVNNTDTTQDPFYEVTGIITLEDIIEEILGEEIVDETDAFLDGTHSVKLDRSDALKFARLRLLDSKIVDEHLSVDETRAVAAHLMKNYDHVVFLLTEHQLNRLIAETAVSVLPTANQEVGKSLPNDLLYEKGVASDCCTLILSGKVSVLVGVDEFRSDVSSWTLLGSGALDDDNYCPDFTAFVSSGPCRCLQISRSRYKIAVDASASELAYSSRESFHSGADPVNTSLDQSELNRKTKLMTALKAVEKSAKDPDAGSGRDNGRESTVGFAEPGLFSESSRRLKPRPQQTSSGEELAPTAPQDREGRKFEYIASPATKFLKDDD